MKNFLYRGMIYSSVATLLLSIGILFMAITEIYIPVWYLIAFISIAILSLIFWALTGVVEKIKRF